MLETTLGSRKVAARGELFCLPPRLRRRQDNMTAEQFGAKYGLWIIAIIIAIFTFKHFLGDTIPGSFFERDADYSAKVYVLLYPDGADSKNYRVPADISRDESGYSVNKVYWSNGGTLDFDDCTISSLPYTELCTPNGSETRYEVRLTQDRVRAAN